MNADRDRIVQLRLEEQSRVEQARRHAQRSAEKAPLVALAVWALPLGLVTLFVQPLVGLALIGAALLILSELSSAVELPSIATVADERRALERRALRR